MEAQACEEERGNLCWTENAGDATTKEEAERTTKAEVYGLNKRRCERVKTVRKRHKEPGEVETMHPLWRPLKQGEGRKLKKKEEEVFIIIFCKIYKVIIFDHDRLYNFIQTTVCVIAKLNLCSCFAFKLFNDFLHFKFLYFYYLKACVVLTA